MAEKQIRVGENLFLGRLNEQQQFREILRTVALTRTDTNDLPFILLIYGEGGMGKTQLIRRMLDIVTTEPPFERDFDVLFLDWQTKRYNTIALQVPRDQIQPETIFDILHQTVIEKGWGAKFKAYQDTLIKQRDVEQQVAHALDQQKENNQYAAIRDLGASGLSKLVRQFVPFIGQTGENFSQVVLSATVQAGAETLANLREQATQFLKAKLKPEQYQMYLNPREQLAKALGNGFKAISQQHPLVLFLDTYEIVTAADAWLRRVIKASSARVIWVIAGRDNLAVNRPGDQYFVGYSGDFVRNLFPMDMQVLAVEHLIEYFADRTSHRPISTEEANIIYRATHGVPLAIHQSADLWMRDIPLAEIVGQTADYASRDEIIREMHRRVLLHVEADTTGDDDRRALYLLAMQPRPDIFVQQEVLQPPEGKFDLGHHLAQLARHYSTVKLEGGARLHESMHSFVQEYLMTSEMRYNEIVIQIANQAVATLHIRREELSGELSSLEDRIESEDWQQATLDLIHWLFWKNERDAWHELIPRFVEGLGYDIDFSKSLLEVANVFKPTLGKDGRKRLKRLNLDTNDFSIMLSELEQMTKRGHWLDDNDPAAAAERHAILLMWRGFWLVENKQYEEALQTYLACERLLPVETETLRKRLGRAFISLSNKFTHPVNKGGFRPSEAGLQAAQRAVILDKENDSAWHALGHANYPLGHKEESIAAFLQSTELDPSDSSNWKCLGDVYGDLGRFDEAINVYQRAVKLNPDFASAHNNLGITYGEMGQFQEALTHHKRATELEPDEASYHNNLGATYSEVEQYQEALIHYKRAMELEPNNVLYLGSLGNIYRKLNRIKEAKVSIEKAINLDPKSASLWHELGHIYKSQHRVELAIEAFEKAITLDHKDVTHRVCLIYLHRELGSIEKTHPIYEEIIQHGLGDATLHNNMGNLYANIGDNESAIVAYKRAVEFDSNYVIAFSNLGNLYHRVGFYEDAIAAYQKSIELNPNFAYPHVSLTLVFREMGRIQEAQEHLAYARKLAKDQAHYNSYIQACLDAVEGNINAALENLANALLETPDMRGWAKYDPNLFSLHSDPRFEALTQMN